MIRTKVLYERVPVLLDTDDESIGQKFEREVRWDAPLLQLEKEKKDNGKGQNPTR